MTKNKIRNNNNNNHKKTKKKNSTATYTAICRTDKTALQTNEGTSTTSKPAQPNDTTISATKNKNNTITTTNNNNSERTRETQKDNTPPPKNHTLHPNCPQPTTKSTHSEVDPNILPFTPSDSSDMSSDEDDTEDWQVAREQGEKEEKRMEKQTNKAGRFITPETKIPAENKSINTNTLTPKGPTMLTVINTNNPDLMEYITENDTKTNNHSCTTPPQHIKIIYITQNTHNTMKSLYLDVVGRFQKYLSKKLYKNLLAEDCEMKDKQLSDSK
uniref:Uncharacterized protein n=1 Tax=Octopus bimaculoides TaxID=37653 RepID=A0A0L8HAA8_OCTBM